MIIFAIVRYEKYWMPLLAKVSDKMVDDLGYVSPMDVHWVWHVHMLAPVQYNKDCTATVNRMLGHEPQPFEQLQGAKLQRTKLLWEEAYPGTPFEVNLNHLKSHPESLDKDESTIKYDIKGAASR